MSNKSETEKQLSEILHKSAKALDIKDYSLNLNLDVLTGDGFASEFYKVSLTDESTKSEIKLAVKKAPTSQKRRELGKLEVLYKNETEFYSAVYPAFHAFEQEHQIPKPFLSVPEYVTSNDDIGKEMIVLKDITVDGFELRDKQLLLDNEHAEFVFQKYGHFHAISFCLKDQKPEEYKRLVQPLANVWQKFAEKDDFFVFFSKLAEQALEALDSSKDAPLIENFQKYVNNMKEIFPRILDYRGDYSCIMHGDCWSNNMMFKYQDSINKRQIEDVKLLDFQLACPGTPVYDLSYFFYAGGSKVLFDKLEDYLDIYYQSFSESVKNLGGNPEKLFPRKVLSQDWEEYSKLGMLLAIFLVKVKLISKEDSKELIEKVNEEIPNVNDSPFLKAKCDTELFGERIRDILLHMHEINAL